MGAKSIFSPPDHDLRRKSKILSDTNQYPDNKLLSEQQQQQTSESGEKSDESSEKYVIDKPEGEDKQCEDEDGKRDDSEKVIRADKKIVGEKLPPGWEKHEGWLPETKRLAVGRAWAIKLLCSWRFSLM